MSLRTKLILSFLTVVVIVSGVGLVAIDINRRLHRDVESLSRRSGYQVPPRPPRNLTLEVEGTWDGRAFTATDVERLPKPRRPKLRGTLDGVDRFASTITIFGLEVVVDSTTQFEPSAEGLASLGAGRRVEVSCRTGDDGRLYARRIRAGGLKISDKIKGAVRDVSIDGVWPDTVDVAGIPVLVGREGAVPGGARSALDRLSIATQLEDALRELLEVAQEVADSAAVSPADGARQVRDGLDDVRYLSGEIMRAWADSTGEGLEEQARIAGDMQELDDVVDDFLGVLANAPQDAGRFFRDDFEPEVRNDIIPTVEFYQLRLVESLAEAATDLVASSERTALLIRLASVVAVLLACVLGLILWKSINAPLSNMTEAAARIGTGDFHTRVPVTSRDQLGELAESFNTMTDRLSDSMVSIDNLNTVKDQLRRSLAEKELLLKEVHHRVKNNLQIVSSLLDLQSGHVEDPETQSLFAESRSRIRSMALIHEQLHRSTDFDQIDFKIYVELLVDGLSQSLGSKAGPVQIEIAMNEARLSVDSAVACGLIINELVTNAAQHAFDGSGGVVSIRFTQTDGRNELCVADNGKGFPMDRREGSLGLELVEALAGQIGGELHITTELGTEFRVEFPNVETEARIS